MKMSIRFYKFFVAALLVVVNLQLMAQDAKRFFEDFSSAAGTGWPIEESKYGIVDFRDGEYYMQSTTYEGLYSQIPNVKINAKKPYTIRLNITCHQGTIGYGFGIAWGEEFRQKANTLVITANRFLNLRQKVTKEDVNVVGPVYCPAIHPKLANWLQVKSDGKKMEISVNNQLVFSGKVKQWSGSCYLVLYNEQVVTFDDIEILYEE